MGQSEPIVTERLLLRPVEASDAEAVWLVHADPETNRHNPAGPMRDHREAVTLTGDWVADWETTGVGYWAVEARESPGEVIGFGGIRQVTWQGRGVYNLYYRLAASAWGRGYAGELARSAVDHWSGLSDRLPLIARTTAENIPSQKTARGVGLIRRPDLDETTDEVTEVVFALGLD